MFLQADLRIHWTDQHHWQACFGLEKGQLLAIYGASGVGKTTLLRVLAGLSQKAKGQLMVDQVDWQDSEKGCWHPPQQRKIGVVFQDYALFPHWTVLQQLRYASSDEILIQTLLEAVGLEPLKNRRPAQLSGGQQQRLALIRALVTRPKLLLLDEPFAALDPPLRQAAHTVLQDLHEQLQGTTILVSHDVSEIIALADRLLVLEQTRTQWYEQPAAYFEAQGLWQTWTAMAQVTQVTADRIWVQYRDQSQDLLRTPALATVQVGDWVEIWGGQTLLGARQQAS